MSAEKRLDAGASGSSAMESRKSSALSRRVIPSGQGSLFGLLIGSDERSHPKVGEVLTTEIIRDVSRVLPWLVSEPPTEPVPADLSAVERTRLLADYAQGFRGRYDSLYPVVDRAGRKLLAESEELNPAEFADPEGEGAAALEAAESHFSAERADLVRFRDTLVETCAPSTHEVFDALDRLDGLAAVLAELHRDEVDRHTQVAVLVPALSQTWWRRGTSDQDSKCACVLAPNRPDGPSAMPWPRSGRTGRRRRRARRSEPSLQCRPEGANISAWPLCSVRATSEALHSRGRGGGGAFDLGERQPGVPSTDADAECEHPGGLGSPLHRGSSDDIRIGQMCPNCRLTDRTLLTDHALGERQGIY